MKKAIQVMATLVAFLLSGQAFAIKVYPTMPPIKDIIGGTATKLADGVKFSGNIFAQEFIPNPINKALAVLPETTIASSAISGLAKKAVLGGLSLGAGVVAGYAIDEMLNGVGWVIDNGAVVKQVDTVGAPVTTSSSKGEYTWRYGTWTPASTASAACPQTASWNSCSMSEPLTGITMLSASSAQCLYRRRACDGSVVSSSYADTNFQVTRSGSSCPAGSTFSTTVGACLGAGTTTKVPLIASDLTILDGFVKNKDGTWQRDLTTQMCGGLESCYQALSPSTVLTGPTTISGSPQTVTTRLPDGSTTTSVKSPTTTVTYGPNWYDYNPVTTTTTTNNGGTTTTTDDSPETFPNVPDMLGGGNDGLKGIKDGISGTTSSTSPIPYMPWFSFSQRCSEITLTIPVYGPFSTAICPVYATYIWPTLYFFFAVFTWIRCWGIWRDTVLRVRAS